MRQKLVVILLFQFVGLLSLINFVGSVRSEPIKYDRANVSSCHDTTMAVSPSLPAENDNITIHIGGTWPNACVPEYRSHIIDGGKIWIDARTPDWPPGTRFCALVFVGWESEIEIGPLDAGWYQTELFINSQHCLSESFLVGGERFFLTPIFR